MADCVDLRESRSDNFRCQSCGHVLAESNARRLLPAGSDVEVSVRSGERLRLRCPKCGVSRLWQAMGAG